METIHFTKTDGEHKRDVFLFALSTCIWCKKTKELLDSIGVAYHYVYVDLLDDEQKKEVRKILKQWNPDLSYPTIVIDESVCVTGFDDDKLKKELADE